jgi:hypothetical protein
MTGDMSYLLVVEEGCAKLLVVSPWKSFLFFSQLYPCAEKASATIVYHIVYCKIVDAPAYIVLLLM